MWIYKLCALNVFGQWHESFFMTRELAHAYLTRAVADGDFIDGAEHTVTSIWVAEEI